ncbi:dna-directed rna polymerase i subunit [Vairimorpha apis BRL 01]|uniref:DNA-directed RNA polymerase subunit n=2 Tax=Vairimorpha apis BRL 01 TaxID=1037528 RepID=T0L0R0_9MICR|nr:dna-directed rna polymerase i subunit [Vairimorpha apis BRL 01]
MLKSHIPEKLEFTFYKDEEIVKMSVMEVTKPLSLDAFNNPYPDGLCDPRMGSHNNDNICKSCNLSFLNCPGHFGYIKLAKPVFNPLIFTTTYSLLKATCFKCGLLKLSKYERIIIYLKLNLLKRGCSIDNLDYLYGINSESKLCKKVADILLENSKVEMISSNFNHQEFVDLILKSAAARNKCLVCRNKGCKLICNKNLKISIVEDNNAKVTYTTFYPEKILEIFKNLFSNERDLMEGMFSTNNFKMFFIFNIAVPPVKFRPMNYLNGRSYENPQNIHYIRILNCNAELNNGKDFWAELQAAILAYYDSSKSSYNKNEHVAGHKQILEKKEGLFRRNIMGKRVNFAARSVISPDPNLKTREMGIPKIFAEKLTFPEKVNLNNYNQLRKAVINGKNYPGANTIQNGKILQSLEFLSHEKRVALANQLLSGNKIVWRHLKDGDNVLVNRQPTLHIPSIMGHKVRVLQGEKTLRMHYVNCKPYNADFDGDEMNVHFPQSDVAQAEIEYLSLNDNMYLVPTNGEPIRGLTQDHIVAASILTLKNSFYTKEHYIDLLVAGLPNRRLKLEAPCISYPIELFSGKQIVTSLLKNLNLNLNLSINGKVDALTWLDHIEEKTVEFKNGEMLTGILDKNVLGPTKFSLIHACGELFGYALTNDLLSYFSNIINRYLFIFGFTMRVDDLLLNKSADILRKKIIEKGELEALKIQKQYIEENPDYYLNLDKTAQLDALVREKMNFVTTEIVKASVPEGQLKRFPENNMGLIIITGAKGSMVNLSQISGSLGQQELEGKRVMHMISGKTLPCFDYFECSPSAGGYVFQRFLTGVEPDEYFFHCMAGREGLIDTAVKTSRSGYLQRCLIKHLEGLKVEYDLSVRMGKKIIQYIYGEDGLDFTKSSFIHKIQFFKDNMSNIKCNENLKITLISFNKRHQLIQFTIQN